MAKKRKKDVRTKLWLVIGDPLVQQIMALLVTAGGVITLLALLEVTRGTWADAWTSLLRYWLGWGAYPAAAAIVFGGLLWLQYHLDRPVNFRWRPIVGAEIAFFGLLAFTHAMIGRENLWGLVQEEWGGGLIGWAISTVLIEYLGWFPSLLILFAFFLLGLGLAFDATFTDVKRAWAWAMTHIQQERARARRRAVAERARKQAAAREPAPARRKRETQARPAPVSAAEKEPEPVRKPPVRDVEAAQSSEPKKQPGHVRVGASSEPAPIMSEPIDYELPPLSLLNEPEGPPLTDQEIRQKSNIIEETLGQFGLPVEVAEVRVGPTVTQFGVKPGFVETGSKRHKVRVNKISALSDDLALALATSRIRVEAPVPGRALVGIEVPNEQIQLVGLREVMESEEFRDLDAPLTFALGRDVAGDAVVADLGRMPHLLIAGTTGSGKSVCIKSFACSLLYNNTPEDLRLVMIDPKMVELVRFNGLPHLLGEVEVDLERIVKVLRWVAVEMDRRYKEFAKVTARHIDDYNRLMRQRGEKVIPRIVVLIDELADLMMLAPDEVERTICRIAQMARATGIHLVVATQRPSTNVVTGLIKANFPARISFATASQVDSRVILDMPGAETLLGKGDMLYLAADAGYPVRIQGTYVSEGEVDRIVDFWRGQGVPALEGSPWEKMIRANDDDRESETPPMERDELIPEAIELVKERGSASASLLQRRLHVGHPRAARIMNALEDMGVIGPPVSGGQTREVIIGGTGEGEEDDES